MTENQREMITANWGKLNLSRQGVDKAKQSMIAALSAASPGSGSTMHHLTSRAASTSLAAEQVKAALVVSHHSFWYCTILSCAILYCTLLYCPVPYCAVLYCTVLYCSVLYYWAAPPGYCPMMKAFLKKRKVNLALTLGCSWPLV